MNTAPVIQVAAQPAAGSNARPSEAPSSNSGGNLAFDGAMKAVGARPARKSSSSRPAESGSGGAPLPSSGNALPPPGQTPLPAAPHATGSAPAATPEDGPRRVSAGGPAAAPGVLGEGQAEAAAGEGVTAGTTFAAGLMETAISLPGGAPAPSETKPATPVPDALGVAALPNQVALTMASAASQQAASPLSPAGTAVVPVPTPEVTAATTPSSDAVTLAAAAPVGAQTVAAKTGPVKADGKVHVPTAKASAKPVMRSAGILRPSEAAPGGGDGAETGATQAATSSPAASPSSASPSGAAIGAMTASVSAPATADVPAPAPITQSFDSDVAVGVVGSPAAAGAPASATNDRTVVAAAQPKAEAATGSARVVTPNTVDGGKPAHVTDAASPGPLDFSSALSSIANAVQQPDAAAPAALRVHASVDSPEFAQGLSERVSWMVDNGVNGAKLQVNPPQLGPIELRISVQGDHARVWMTTHSAVAREALESGSSTLKEMLGAQGFGQVSVDISQRSFQDRPAYTPPYERESAATRSAVTATAAAASVASARASAGALDAYA